MFRKLKYHIPISFVFIVAFVAAGYSQGAIRGTVMLLNPDGTRTPVANAVVETYRMDLETGRGPTTKTNDKGVFTITVPSSRPYTISVSGSGIAPTIARDVPPGTDNLQITVSPGDGRQYTEAELRAAFKQGAGAARMTEAEAKKAQEEYDAKVKEVTERNEKAKKAGEIINIALKEGNDAYKSKNYEVAAAKYSEGIAADPEFVGSAPVLYNNKAAALNALAIDTYNSNVKVEDASQKVAGMATVRKLFSEAVDSYAKSWKILKGAPASEIDDQQQYQNTKLQTLRGAMETLRLSVRTEQVAPEVIAEAQVLVPEYVAVETDPAKKLEADLILGDLYRITENREKAIESYRKVLERAPDNADALAMLGIVLVDLGWLKDNDKALTQEGANYLQKFVSVAPDNHKFKTGAVEYLEILKTQNVVPDKKAPAPRRRP